MNKLTKSFSVISLFVLILCMAVGSADARGKTPNRVKIFDAAVDWDDNTITINGKGFGKAPKVLLDGLSLDLISSSNRTIVADLPTDPEISSGTYRITVARKGFRRHHPQKAATMLLAIEVLGTDMDGDGWTYPEDCDDTKIDVHPEADTFHTEAYEMTTADGCVESFDYNCDGELEMSLLADELPDCPEDPNGLPGDECPGPCYNEPQTLPSDPSCGGMGTVTEIVYRPVFDQGTGNYFCVSETRTRTAVIGCR